MPSCIRVPSMATAPRPSCSGRSNAGPCRACPHPAPHSAHQRLTVIGFWRRDGYRRWPRHRGTASPQQHIPGVAQRLCPHGYQIQPKHSEPEGDPAATDPRHESRVEGALVSAFGTPRTVRSSLSPEESGVRSSAVTPTRVCERQRLQPFDLPVYVDKGWLTGTGRRGEATTRVGRLSFSNGTDIRQLLPRARRRCHNVVTLMVFKRLG